MDGRVKPGHDEPVSTTRGVAFLAQFSTKRWGEGGRIDSKV
jgi:hypothetical protein